jgi:hypothetical protein
MSGFKNGKRSGSKTDNTNAQQKPWLFKPGQSGNPAGRPKGSRNKLAEDFLSDAYQQWQQHGSKALETMATSEPAKFCQMVASLLPKEMHIKDSALEHRRHCRRGIVSSQRVATRPRPRIFIKYGIGYRQ